MLMLLSFLSFFSSFVCMPCCDQRIEPHLHEKNEKYEESSAEEDRGLSVFSFSSFFSSAVYPDAAFPSCASIEESQPTVRGHALRCSLPGWWGAAAPSTPKKL